MFVQILYDAMLVMVYFRVHESIFLFQVVQNDVDAHRESVDSVKEAGARVVASEKSSDTPIKRKLSEVNGTWTRVQDKCDKKYTEFKDSLREVGQSSPRSRR